MSCTAAHHQMEMLQPYFWGRLISLQSLYTIYGSNQIHTLTSVTNKLIMNFNIDALVLFEYHFTATRWIKSTAALARLKVHHMSLRKILLSWTWTQTSYTASCTSLFHV